VGYVEDRKNTSRFLKGKLKERPRSGLDLSGTGYGKVAGFCKHIN
jgi:hypothetical protein